MIRAFALAFFVLGCAGSPPAPEPLRDVAQHEISLRLAEAVGLLAAEPPDADGALRLLVEIDAMGIEPQRSAARSIMRIVEHDVALRRSATSLAADSQEIRRRLGSAERALTQLQVRTAAGDELAIRLQEERARLAKKLEEAEARIAEQQVQIRALREELEALKRIDMQRSP